MALPQAEIFRLTELNRSGFNYILPDGTVIPTIIGGGQAPTVSVKSVLSGGTAAPIPQAILDYGRQMLGGVTPKFDRNETVYDLGSSQGQNFSTQASRLVSDSGLKDPNEEFLRQNPGFSNPNRNFNYGVEAPAAPPATTGAAPGSPAFIDNTPTGNNLAQAPVETMAGISSPITPGGTTQTHVMGEAALVQFKEFPGQVWLLDPQTKTLRPFKNDTAFNNSFADPMAARGSIHTVSNAELGVGGALFGYQPISDPKYFIQEDGRAPALGASPAQISARYGGAINEEAELQASRTLDGFLNMLKNPATGAGLTPDTINKILGDKNTVAFYINALAYGGYTPEDVYRDIKRKELVSQGRNDLDAIRPISVTQNKSQYAASDDYRNAATNPALSSPARLAGIDIEKYNLPIFSLPDELFKVLVPIADPNSPEFRKKLEEVDAQMYDILTQQLTAQTDQQKALADYNWEELRGKIERELGILLSNDAIAAWDQLENIYNTASQTGLSGSGLQAESIDDYLRKVRLTDQRAREAAIRDEEHADADYYTKFATPAQIKELIQEDQTKGLPKEEWRATRWGLIPSDDIKAQFNLAKMRELYPLDKYPELTDTVLSRMVSSVLDENGNYRSNLYQKYMAGNNMTYGGDDTGGGVMDIEFSRDQYKSAKVYEKALLDEKNRYAAYTKAESPFLRSTATGPLTASGNVPASAIPQYANISSVLASAAANKRGITPAAPAHGSAPTTPTNVNASGGSTAITPANPTPTSSTPQNPARPITPVSVSSPVPPPKAPSTPAYPSLSSLGGQPFSTSSTNRQTSTPSMTSTPRPPATPLSAPASTAAPAAPLRLSNIAAPKLPSVSTTRPSTPATSPSSGGLLGGIKNAASKALNTFKGLWG